MIFYLTDLTFTLIKACYMLLDIVDSTPDLKPPEDYQHRVRMFTAFYTAPEITRLMIAVVMDLHAPHMGIDGVETLFEVILQSEYFFSLPCP